METRLIIADRVVRERHGEPGRRAPKARWVIHVAGCAYAPGCGPLSDLVARIGERGIILRVRGGTIARCVACRPVLVERITDQP